VPFGAPAAGWYHFTAARPQSDYEVRLYARAECLAPQSELVCLPFRGEPGFLLELAAGEQIAIILDTNANTRTHPDWILTAVRADEDAAPQVTARRARALAADQSQAVDLEDPNADQRAADFLLMRGGARVDSFLTRFALHGERIWAGQLVVDISRYPDVDRVDVLPVDLEGNRGALHEIAVTPQPVVAPGAPCDLERIDDRCAAGHYCAGETDQSTCTVASPPRLLRASARFNEDNSGVGLQVTGTDPDDDVKFLRYTLFDEAGAPLLQGREFTALLEAESADGDFTAIHRTVHRSPVGTRLPLGSVRLQVVDTADLASEPIDVDFLPPVSLREGQPCSPNQAFGVCREGLVCRTDDAGERVCVVY
jgi:hypothetical protein